MDCLARPLKAGRAGQLIVDAAHPAAFCIAVRVLRVDTVGVEMQVHSASVIRSTRPVVAVAANAVDAAVTVEAVAPRRIGKFAIRYTERFRLLAPI